MDGCCSTDACGVVNSDGALVRFTPAAASAGICIECTADARAACGNCEKTRGGAMVTEDTAAVPAVVAVAGEAGKGDVVEPATAVVESASDVVFGGDVAAAEEVCDSVVVEGGATAAAVGGGGETSAATAGDFSNHPIIHFSMSASPLTHGWNFANCAVPSFPASRIMMAAPPGWKRA